MQGDCLARRSAQTAMYHIIEGLVRWLAPVLSFTAEEIWQHIPGERAESVFLEEWYESFPELTSSLSVSKWQNIIDVRDAVSKELERLRIAGDIGSALDAEVSIYCNGEIKTSLDQLEDELRYVLITSYANVFTDTERPESAVETSIKGLWISASASQHNKCVRCWHHREDVGKHDKHPELCGRCVENVDGEGESRRYA